MFTCIILGVLLVFISMFRVPGSRQIQLFHDKINYLLNKQVGIPLTDVKTHIDSLHDDNKSVYELFFCCLFKRHEHLLLCYQATYLDPALYQYLLDDIEALLGEYIDCHETEYIEWLSLHVSTPSNYEKIISSCNELFEEHIRQAADHSIEGTTYILTESKLNHLIFSWHQVLKKLVHE